MQQLFAGLREGKFFAHPVKKPTAHVALQRLHRVAYPRLRHVQLTRSLRKTARSGQHTEGAELPAIQWNAHL